MHIGLIGGIGPAATVSYYTRLIQAFRDAGLPLELTIVHADVAQLISNSTRNDRKAQAALFAHHLRQLKGAGCDVATITALTGHFCFAETQAMSPLPLMSAIDPIDQYCAERGIGVLGLLGSSSVLNSQLFGQLTETKTVAPTSDIDALGTAYFEMAQSGVCSDLTRKQFFAAGLGMSSEGADAILLAGTDLGLAFDGIDPGFPVVDALEIHVKALVKMAAG